MSASATNWGYRGLSLLYSSSLPLFKPLCWYHKGFSHPIHHSLFVFLLNSLLFLFIASYPNPLFISINIIIIQVIIIINNLLIIKKLTFSKCIYCFINNFVYIGCCCCLNSRVITFTHTFSRLTINFWRPNLSLREM